MNQINEVLKAELKKLGFSEDQEIKYNLNIPEMVSESLMNGESQLADTGALVVNTSPFTGRSPNDKYLVENGDPDLYFATGTEAMSSENFDLLSLKMIDSLKGSTLYVRDVLAGADPQNTVHIRVITDLSWQSLAASNMFIANSKNEPHVDPDFTLIVSSKFVGDPTSDGLRSAAMVAMNFDKRLVLIGNTRYAGEIKKSVFTLMN